MQSTATRTGAEVLADQLARWGVRLAFHVPGEGILEILDALAVRHPALRLVQCRNESGMAFAASGAARVTGRPGICFAPRAPGALNTCLALHTAMTDAVPMIMVIGQASMAAFEREPYLDTEFHRTFAGLSKWVGLVPDAGRIPEFLSRAWHAATSGRMGPVVLVVPENVLQAQTAARDLDGPPAAVRAAPSHGELDMIARQLREARRPLLLLGGTGWNAEDCAALGAFAAGHALPVLVTYRRRDLFDNADPHFAGEIGIGVNAATARLVREADLLLAVGVRLGELNTIGGGFHGFGLIEAPRPQQRLIHIHPAAEELNRVFQADLAIVATPHETAQALAAWRGAPPETDRTAWLTQARRGWEDYVAAAACPGPLDLPAVYRWLRRRLPADTMVAVGAGAYALWPQRCFSFHRAGTQLGPKSGAMGYGLPAAIGAAFACPERRALAIAGDGCFMMTAEELATAVHHHVPVVTLVANNAAYGAIRLTQQRLFGRATGTDLTNPDFIAFARSFGMPAERVTATAEFAPAFERAWAAHGPALIELAIVPEATRPA